VKRLSERQLSKLASEVRELIIRSVSSNGGHLASNLGVVELTIALHRVFDSPRDRIVWDVGHQCYAHKILTGRRDAFPSLRKRGGLSGFPKRSESVHDAADTGHASTAISYALGLLVGRERLGIEGKVIAVVGDGSLGGGLSFEGLNHAGHLGRGLIIVLNDNEMSIGRNVGALSSYLSRLTTTRAYRLFRNSFDGIVAKLPVVGSPMLTRIYKLKRVMKAIVYRETLFADLGFDYVGPIDGHNISLLCRVLTNVRGMDKPVVVHVITRKGKGYPLAEKDPTRWHGVGSFSLLDGKLEESAKLTFSEAFSSAMVRAAGRDDRLVAVTAAMVDGTGLRPLQREFPSRVFDVGITEEHAVTFSAGLAATGLRPVVCIYSTFLQRGVDQIVHDVALPGLPVVFAVDRAGLVAGDGETHQGTLDIALLRCIPGLSILAPSCRAEMELFLEYALSREGPTVLRYPKAVCGPDLPELAAPVEEGRGIFVRRNGAEVLLICVGGLLPEVLAAAHMLDLDGISSDIYALRFIKPIDVENLLSVVGDYDAAFCVEEGTHRGGVGEELSHRLRESGARTALRVLAAPDSFLAQASRRELLAQCGLDGAGICLTVEAASQAAGWGGGVRMPRLAGPSSLFP